MWKLQIFELVERGMIPNFLFRTYRHIAYPRNASSREKGNFWSNRLGCGKIV
jgi:hypothetical protein